MKYKVPALAFSIIIAIQNVFEPMDFTPMILNKFPKINRNTTNGFELAFPVIFQSGVQHLAETPDGMARVPV